METSWIWTPGRPEPDRASLYYKFTCTSNDFGPWSLEAGSGQFILHASFKNFMNQDLWPPEAGSGQFLLQVWLETSWIWTLAARSWIGTVSITSLIRNPMNLDPGPAGAGLGQSLLQIYKNSMNRVVARVQNVSACSFWTFLESVRFVEAKRSVL